MPRSGKAPASPPGRAPLRRGVAGVGPSLVVVLVVLVAIASSAGCGPRTPAEKIEAWRGSSVSKSTWERVRPHLEALAPGDDLRIFAAAREVYSLGRGPRARPVVVIPAWITSLSGGAAGGASLLGQLVGRRGDRLYGSHVFGFVTGGRIVPRYQLMTTATTVDAETFARLVRERAPGIGMLPRPGGVLYFRDLYVVGGRALGFPEPEPEPEPASPAASAAGVPAPADFYSQDAYREASPVLESLPVGTDLLTMLQRLGAEFLSDDFGETHSLRAPGFLHYKQIRTVSLEGPDGVFKLRPFGFVEDDREVVERVAVFENDRLRGVVPYTGFADTAPYLRATAGADPGVTAGVE